MAYGSVPVPAGTGTPCRRCQSPCPDRHPRNLWVPVFLRGQIPSWPSSVHGVIRLVGDAVFEDPEAQMHQFSHGRAQRGLFAFSCFEQALVKGADVGIVAGPNQGRHV
ncbi:hypothetical protein L522_4522 [Bordetella bronchiseptica MBORD707]|nr:hypothetical protein L522_4522 [Bordetella bronchiseptica MBORD707]